MILLLISFFSSSTRSRTAEMPSIFMLVSKRGAAGADKGDRVEAPWLRCARLRSTTAAKATMQNDGAVMRYMDSAMWTQRLCVFSCCYRFDWMMVEEDSRGCWLGGYWREDAKLAAGKIRRPEGWGGVLFNGSRAIKRHESNMFFRWR